MASLNLLPSCEALISELGEQWPLLKNALDKKVEEAERVDDVVEIFRLIRFLHPRTMQDQLVTYIRAKDFHPTFSRIKLSSSDIVKLQSIFQELDKAIHPDPKFLLTFQSYFEWYQSISQVEENILNANPSIDLAANLAKGKNVIYSASHAGLLAGLNESTRRFFVEAILRKITIAKKTKREQEARLQAWTKETVGDFRAEFQAIHQTKGLLRNLEFFLYQLSISSVEQLAKDLKHSTSILDIKKAISGHFGRVYPEQFRQGKYGVDTIFDVAHLIQNEFRSSLAPDEYLELFGSFPDGGADRLSDVDIRLSWLFSRFYISIFGKDARALRAATRMGEDTEHPKFPVSQNYYLPVIAGDQMSTRQQDAFKAFSGIEQKLAAKLHLQEFKKTKLFAISSVSFDDLPLTPLDTSHSISILVYADRVIIKIFLNKPSGSSTETFVIAK